VFSIFKKKKRFILPENARYIVFPKPTKETQALFDQWLGIEPEKTKEPYNG